jgi:hypothetical protein
LQQNNSHELLISGGFSADSAVIANDAANPWWSTIIEFTRCVGLFRLLHPNICPSWTDTHGFCAGWFGIELNHPKLALILRGVNFWHDDDQFRIHKVCRTISSLTSKCLPLLSWYAILRMVFMQVGLELN